ncbi:hypothetical protein HY224_02490 [Candidatus Uhrbacteria bacterium]|nr:hypothetical protein [Candidatus Uhrbacteria bacterium]
MYYTGLTNLFTQPEFHNAQLVINFTRLLDHLDEMISQIFDLVDQDIKVMVGKENPFGQEFGTMITKCQFDQRQGLLVLLGPMRMDYEDNLGLMNFSKFLIESQKYD